LAKHRDNGEEMSVAKAEINITCQHGFQDPLFEWALEVARYHCIAHEDRVSGKRNLVVYTHSDIKGVAALVWWTKSRGVSVLVEDGGGWRHR